MATVTVRAQKPRTPKKFTAIAETISDIVSSREVTTFCIGITRSLDRRKASYKGWVQKAFEGHLRGFAVIDWEHTPDTALKLEQWLFENFHRHNKYVNRDNVKYFANANRGEGTQYVYVAWW